ncbi:hypothetical protein GCM10023224_00970 [Streptomonospora halophila]|uniref:Uncharacterized protein n=1 Tax=Streptomonospora halophila TaxID=427369 RepID=A0ABP9G8L2_9ACTN
MQAVALQRAAYPRHTRRFRYVCPNCTPDRELLQAAGGDESARMHPAAALKRCFQGSRRNADTRATRRIEGNRTKHPTLFRITEAGCGCDAAALVRFGSRAPPHRARADIPEMPTALHAATPAPRRPDATATGEHPNRRPQAQPPTALAAPTRPPPASTRTDDRGPNHPPPLTAPSRPRPAGTRTEDRGFGQPPPLTAAQHPPLPLSTPRRPSPPLSARDCLSAPSAPPSASFVADFATLLTIFVRRGIDARHKRA